MNDILGFVIQKEDARTKEKKTVGIVHLPQITGWRCEATCQEKDPGIGLICVVVFALGAVTALYKHWYVATRAAATARNFASTLPHPPSGAVPQRHRSL